MTASAGAWYRVGAVNVVSGQQAVTGVGSNWQNDVTAIAVGDIFTLDAKTWYEVIAVNSDTSITLDREYEGNTQNSANYAIVRNTSGTILTRVAGQIAVQFNQKQLFLDELRKWLNSDNASEELTDSHGLKKSLKTPAQMVRDHDNKLAEIDAIHPYPWALRKGEWEAHRAANDRIFAASGYVYKGKVYTASEYEKIAEGLFTDESTPNILREGRKGGTGDSKTDYPVLHIAGVLTRLEYLSVADNSSCVIIKLPEAEDGTRAYDSATGESVTHATPVLAFASETATNKVVTNRVDMRGYELFLREITPEDPSVYRFGLIQSLAPDINGVPTSPNTTRPDSYFAWFDGDNTSRGNDVDWYAATDEERKVIGSDYENNIIFDDETGKWHQWCVRGRSFAGRGNGDWDTDGNSLKVTTTAPLRFANDLARVVVQGNKSVTSAFSIAGGDCYANLPAWGSLSGKFYTGVYSPRNSSNNSGAGASGECYFLVCGTVNRLNKGAYHPSLNPLGTKYFAADTTGDGNINTHANWYSVSSIQTTVIDCFTPLAIGSSGIIGVDARTLAGAIGGGSGRPDARFYDAIYASGWGGVCRDMRYPASGLTAEDFAEQDLKIKSGEYRGREMLEHTLVTTSDYANNSVAEGFRIYRAQGVIGDLSVNEHRYSGGYIVTSDGDVIKYSRVRHFTTVDETYFYTDIPSADAQPSWTGSSHIIMTKTLGVSVAGEYTHTEIIGAPEQILLCDNLKEGWVGSWNPVIPTGDNPWNTFETSRPTNDTTIDKVQTDNNGASWLSGTHNFSPALSAPSATTSPPLGRVEVWHYNTKAKMTTDVVNTEVFGRAKGVGDVFASSNSGDATGRGLGFSLISKILTSNSGIAKPRSVYGSHSLLNYNLLYDKLSSARMDIEHTPLLLPAPNNNGPAFKALNYNVAKNQQGFINYAYTQLTYDATAGDWGDDGKIHIADNQTTMPDENGHINLVGMAQCVEPIGWIKNDK